MSAPPQEAQGSQGEAWDAEGEELDDGDAGGGGGGGLAFEAAATEVLRRIRSATLWFVSQLCEGQLPEIDLVLDAGDGMVPGTDGQLEDDGGGGVHAPRVQRRSLLRPRQPESAEQVARLWVLLAEVHSLLSKGAQATQRELWYRFKTVEVFRSPRDVHEAVQDAVALLQVPRSALGIIASSKGLVAGRLVIHDSGTGTETDCASSGSGVQIPGDPGRIARNFSFQTDAQLVLVVEKDAIFQRLVQQRFYDVAPCVLVTGKGVPDLATRAFLSRLSAAFPHLPLCGVVDWNPAGCGILCTYRFGSRRMGLESPHYALPSLGWLGARSPQLRHADADAFQELTPRDRSLAANLTASLQATAPEWAAEVQAMLASGRKAELEALDTTEGAGGLPDLLLRCLEQADCI